MKCHDHAQNFFDQQKLFMYSVVKRAKTLQDLSLLDYEPPFVTDYMVKFAVMIEEFEFEYVNSGEVYWPLKPDKIQQCQKHGTYKHLKGCNVCNDK